MFHKNLLEFLKYSRKYYVIIVELFRNINQGGSKCRNKSINPVNALILAAATETARPARSITATMAQGLTVVTHKSALLKGVDEINATGYGAQ
jgi:urease gamma subunit